MDGFADAVRGAVEAVKAMVGKPLRGDVIERPTQSYGLRVMLGDGYADVDWVFTGGWTHCTVTIPAKTALTVDEYGPIRLDSQWQGYGAAHLHPKETPTTEGGMRVSMRKALHIGRAWGFDSPQECRQIYDKVRGHLHKHQTKLPGLHGLPGRNNYDTWHKWP